MRRAALTIMSVCVMALGLFVPVAAAQAESGAPTSDSVTAQASCPSSPQGTPHSLLDGRITVRVLYSTANGGTNCVWAVKNVGVGTPESRLFNVSLYMCQNTGSPYQCNKVDDDPGYWSYYAGPAVATSTAGRCIGVLVEFRGLEDFTGRVHCGG